MRGEVGATITIGEGGTVVIRRNGVSARVIAQALGIERDSDGAVLKLWLDRLVHQPGEVQLGSWRVSGAVSSVLELVV